MLYQTKTSKKNNLKFNRLKLILHKVKFIAKNVIYIKNFSSEIKKSNNTLANSLPIILNYPSLKKDKILKIAKLGTFKIKDKNSRIGRNPKTGKESIISARSVVTFNASEKLKSRLNLE